MPRETDNSAECIDEPNFIDVDGDSCAWYEMNELAGCPLNGWVYDANGTPASDACCHCGGGALSTTVTPAPTPSETDICNDDPGWTDMWGIGADCAFLEVMDMPGCPLFGWVSDANGKVASDACCHCKTV